MTHILSDSSIVPLNHSHICNQCTNRNFSALEAVEASETARHLCGIEPGEKRRMVRDDAGAVVHCTEYSGKRTRCPHLPGDLPRPIPGLDCELGYGCTCVQMEAVA
ncbi:MAG: hypothetical protein R3F02_18570 [Thiolinea sp.]